MGTEYYPTKKLLFEDFVKAPIPRLVIENISGDWYIRFARSRYRVCLHHYYDGGATAFEMFGSDYSEGRRILQDVALHCGCSFICELELEYVSASEVRRPTKEEVLDMKIANGFKK